VAAEIDVGLVIAGKYELVRLIGKGAMGEVWLATHNTLGGEFAIKLVKPSDDDEDETAAGRFQLEAQVSAKLSRKTRHIISVSDHGEEDGLAYLVMELLDGESLDARIKRTGELELPLAVAIVMQIARALGQAHSEGIFHRDLKPANVFLTKDEDGRLLVKLLDFGIARSAKPARTRSPFMTGKDMVLGTPSYMSPEQARGLDSLDHRCDLWALAVVAYEMLTGNIPWHGETVEDIFLSICTHRMTPILSRRKDLPPVVEDVFARSFAPKLDDRFRNAAELSDAFELLVDPLEVEAVIGARPAPASSRRLPMPSGPQPSSGHLATPEPMSLRRSDPSIGGGAMSDPGASAVGGPTLFLQRQKRSNSWLLAAIAGIATIVILLLVTAFSMRKRATSTPPPDPMPVAATNDRASIPPPTPSETSTPTAPPTNTAPVVKATAARPKAVSARPTPATAEPPPPAVVTTPPPPPVVTAHPTPPPPPPPASAPTRKPLDKGEVF
jgi:serine/threonine-protein kinase